MQPTNCVLTHAFKHSIINCHRGPKGGCRGCEHVAVVMDLAGYMAKWQVLGNVAGCLAMWQCVVPCSSGWGNVVVIWGMWQGVMPMASVGTCGRGGAWGRLWRDVVGYRGIW